MLLFLRPHGAQDCSFSIPPGKLTVVVAGAEAEAAVQALVSLIWDAGGCGDQGAGGGGGGAGALAALQRGRVSIHGRDAKDWDIAALRQRIALLKDSDGDVPLDIGFMRRCMLSLCIYL